MKLLGIALLATLPLAAQVASKNAEQPTPAGLVLNGQPVRIALGTFSQIERDSDGKLEKIGDANFPIDLLGATRGIYLDGYGAVFTSEISLMRSPTVNPFQRTISREQAEQVHQKKAERLNALRAALKDMVQSAARTLFLVPENQQIVFAVRLDYFQWENTSGLPGLVLMRADRKSALAGNVHLEEQ